ncbi:MAG: hypothetical protein JJU41_00765 [Bacteroidetes bacterium]|nr:hypothetical protein [Bacteroidota bacterium]MCH8525122.1 hypothetical protein [Balneolales bacterium]
MLTLIGSTFFTISCDLGDSCVFDDRFRTLDFAALENRMLFVPGSDVPQFQQIGGRTVLFSEYAVSFVPIAETYTSENAPIASLFQPINEARAVCVIPNITSDERVLNISITADKDYTPEFPAGSELRSLFNVYTIYLAIGATTQSLESYLQGEPTVADQTTFLLNTPPQLAEDIRFTITYELDGEKLREFSYTTDARRLLRTLDF